MFFNLFLNKDITIHKKEILDELIDFDLLMSDTHEDKMSFHVIFYNIRFKCLKCMKLMIKQFLKEYADFFTCNIDTEFFNYKMPDMKVYGKNQMFRLPGQTKLYKNNKLNLITEDICNDGYITHFKKGLLNFECMCDTIDESITTDKKVDNKVNCKKNFNDEIKFNKDLIIKAVMSLNPSRSTEVQTWKIISAFLYNTGLFSNELSEYYKIFVQFSLLSPTFNYGN